jgi:parallel beta-helix repeat protein
MSRVFNATGIRTSDATVIGNSVSKNRGVGISAHRSSVTHNTANSNGDAGIRALCPSSVVGNTAVQNEGQNLLLVGSGCTTAHNAAP